MKQVLLALATLPLGLMQPASAQDAAAGEKVFLVCRTCHQIGPGAKNSIGPEQNGLVGRQAGSVPGYNYSNANKSSGITWTEDELKKYIKEPQKIVPGTKMVFAGIKDDKKIDDLIAYLKQFKPDGSKVQ